MQENPEQWDNAAMNAPQPISPRRRLQELLEIPDSQRTEAEWDELNELEISLAPGNRVGAPDPSVRRPGMPSGGLRKPGRGPKIDRPPKAAGQLGVVATQPKPTEDGQPRKPARKFRKRGPKPPAPEQA
jgi:hypothetical protein